MKKSILAISIISLTLAACGGGGGSTPVVQPPASKVWTGSTLRSAGTFTVDVYGPAGNYELIGAGDLNGDGHDDIILSPMTFDARWHKVIIGFYNPVSGNFEPDALTQSRMPTMQWGQKRAVIEDFNKDGYVDFFLPGTGRDNSVCGEASVLVFGSKDGLVDASHLLPRYSTYTHQAVVSDFNNDGYKDIFQLNNNWGSQSDPGCADRIYPYTDTQYLISTKDWTFSTPHQYIKLDGRNVLNPTGGGASAAAAADFDGDGNSDIVMFGLTALKNSIIFLKGDGKGNFADPIIQSFTPYLPTTWTGGMAARDLDGDGKPELILSSTTDVFYDEYGGRTITIMKLNAASNEFVDMTSSFIKNPDFREKRLTWCLEFHWVDLNRDGRDDMICTAISDFTYADFNDNATRVWFGTNTGFEPANITAPIMPGMFGNMMPAVLNGKTVIVGSQRYAAPGQVTIQIME